MSLFSIFSKNRKLFDQAMKHLQSREFDKSRDILEELTKLTPDNFDYQLNLASCLIELEQFESALEILDRIISEASPLNPVPAIMKGYTLYKLNRNSDALIQLKTALAIDVKHPACHYYLGLVYLALGKIDAATDHFQEVAAEEPQFVTARLLALGELMLSNKNYQGKKVEIDNESE